MELVLGVKGQNESVLCNFSARTEPASSQSRIDSWEGQVPIGDQVHTVRVQALHSTSNTEAPYSSMWGPSQPQELRATFLGPASVHLLT